jgi:hypothetical protein
MRKATRTRAWRAAVAGVALVAGGCGDDSEYANTPRGPAPVAVDAFVSDGRLTVSPAHVGAGPIRLIVANGSSKSLDVRVDPVDADGAGARSGPINPQDTAELQLDVSEGTYRVRAAPGSAARAELHVGRRRASAQNQLLLP